MAVGPAQIARKAWKVSIKVIFFYLKVKKRRNWLTSHPKLRNKRPIGIGECDGRSNWLKYLKSVLFYRFNEYFFILFILIATRNMITMIIINNATENWIRNFHDTLNVAAFFLRNSPNPRQYEVKSLSVSALRSFIIRLIAWDPNNERVSKMRKIFNS